MNQKSPKLIINRLVLVGREKKYIVDFHVGLNIIYGDSDTGKSSILNLIDYLLGSQKIYMYDEIEQHGKYAMLEVVLNDRIYTIKRDIFNPKQNIEVYSSEIENINNTFALEYSPDYNTEGPAGYFSDFLLSSLNAPIIKIKQSPSKEDSKMVRLSFRDIFKYCYLDQDDVGSKEILDRKNYSLVAKNKETFKYLHNVLDTQITEMERAISEKKREQQELAKKYNVVSSFLLESKLSTEESLREEKGDLKKKMLILKKEKDDLSEKMRSDNEELEDLRKVVINLDYYLNDLTKKKHLKENQLQQNLRLKKEYKSDMNKLKTSLQVKKGTDFQRIQNVECPLCNNPIDTVNATDYFIQYNESVIKKEINSIRNRTKGLSQLIEQLRDELFLIDNKINKYTIELAKAIEHLEISAEKFVSPYISQRDLVVAELYSFKEKLEKIEYLLKIRKKLSEVKQNENTFINQIGELRGKLELLKEKAPSIEDTLNNIGTYLQEFLDFIPIKNAFGINISEKTYLPIVRNREYTELTSGGLRTLVSIGYISSLLKNSLYKDTNFPSLIMIDTVGKYLGKTEKTIQDTESESNETKQEGLDDPKKYSNIYKYLEEMSKEFIKKDIDHQIILVDNDFPESLDMKYNQYVRKRFSTNEKEGFEIGFINNASPVY